MPANDTVPGLPEGVPKCHHCTFGLIVTGEGEREFLPSLFRTLMERAGCSFKVVRRIGQRGPVTSPPRILKMVGCGRRIPTRDEDEIGLPARRFLREKPCRFVLLIDDAEASRRPKLAPVFHRYRQALDALLDPAERGRASVHFLANMLEAYYFADSRAVNAALDATVLPADHAGDVEDIGHPKGKLKATYPAFDEKAHGGEIVKRLDLDRVLDGPTTCAFLRAMFAWCVVRLVAHCPVHDPHLQTRYQLPSGVKAELTSNQ